MQEVSSCTIGHKPTRPRLQKVVKRSAGKFPEIQTREECRSRSQARRTSSIQRTQFLCRENGNLLVVKLVPVVIVVIDRPLVGLGSLAGFGMENTLLSEPDVMTGIRRRTLVRDDRCPFVVRAG